jgi:hypothetical protein
MTAWRFEPGRRALPWLGAVLIACSAYDAGILERESNAGGRGGNGGRGDPTGGNGGSGDPAGGNGGNGGRVATGGGGGGSGGRGAPAAGNGGSGGESSSAMCGDGNVAPSEKCDTAIDEGPGACPAACPPIDQCVTRMLTGSNCQAECVVLAETCTDADGCCPQTCSVDNDDDCPDHCGDGMLQEDEGETCDPSADEGPPCTTQADCDDGDPCTTDMLIGSEANCNPSCTRTTISTLQAGDQCCPDGANANTDGDCMPDCGNQIEETGEECDGGASCDGDCNLIPTPEQQDCLDRFVATGMPDEACERCACFNCLQQVLDCRDDADATRRMRCDTLVACALDNDCNGQACYCGNVDIITCGLSGPTGPCIPEVEQAAGPSTNPLEINQRQRDPNYALGRANLLGECSSQQCPDICP